MTTARSVLALTGALALLACDAKSETTQPDEAAAMPSSEGEPSPAPEDGGDDGSIPPELEGGDAMEGDALAGAETISFDDTDATAGPAEPIGGIAPRRKKIESFQLFGTGGRGGPG